MSHIVAEHQFTTWKDGVPDTIDTFVTNHETRRDIKLLPINNERYSRQAAEGNYHQVLNFLNLSCSEYSIIL